VSYLLLILHLQVEVRASSRRPRAQTGTDSAIGRIAAAHAQREERQKKKKQEEEKAERSRKKRQQQDEEEEEQEEEEEAEESGEWLQRCCASIRVVSSGK
jgi:predicted ribosome quality control (RQC) complex YloA/Tae2 family protein